MDSKTIILLIDADNASPIYVEELIDRLNQSGSVIFSKAYGDWSHPCLSGWSKILHKHAIIPVQQFNLTKQKNATDIAMVIDAMDLLYTNNANSYCIMSSDADFTPLAVRLRAAGKHVIGAGNKKASQAFKGSCNEFIELEESLQSCNEYHVNPSERFEACLQKSTPEKHRQHVYDLIHKHNNIKGGWIYLSVLISLLSKNRFRPSEYGFKTIRSFILSLPEVEFRYRNQRNTTQLRIMNTG